MNNILKIPAFQRKKAIPKQLKDLELLPLNEEFSKLTMPIVSDDDLRPSMTGNYFDMEKKKIASTDAHKLVAINMPNETFNYISNNYKEPKGLIFHTISQLQKEYNDLVKLAYKNNSTDFQSFNEFVKFREIEDGRYPNYEAVTPKEFVAEINVDYQKLYWYAKVLVDAKVIDDINKIDSGNYYVYQNKKIEYLKDSYVSFLNPSTKQILLTYTLDGKKEYIGFNAKLLCEILKFAMELNGKYFGKVGLNATGKAMVIELENGLNVSTNSIGLIMPVILNRGESTNTIGNDGSPLDEMKTYEMYYDLDTNSIISDKENYPIDSSIGFMPNKAGGSIQKMTSAQGKMEKHTERVIALRKNKAEQESKVENNSEDLIDKKIRGLKIALKVAIKGEEKLIEKRILALEIAKKMSNPKVSVSEKMSKLDNNKIKDWYIKNYPADDEKNKLDDKNTFEDLWNGLGKNKDIYEVIGIGDSLIRERLFGHLAELKGVDYDVVYNKWLDSRETGDNVDKRNKEGMIYALQEFISAGTIANKTDYSTYDKIAEIRSKAIKYYEKNGDKQYSLGELDKVLSIVSNSISDKFTKGGSLGFKGLSNKVASRYEGKKVPQRFQSIYGKTYSQSEAKEVGNKVAGKVYREQRANKMKAGGSVDGGDYVREELNFSDTMEYAKGGYTRPSYKINTTGFFSFKTKDKEYIVRSSFFERQNDIEDSLQIQDDLRGELGSIIITNSAWKRLSDGNTIKARSNKGNLTGTLTRVANLNENYSLNKMAKGGSVEYVDTNKKITYHFLRFPNAIGSFAWINGKYIEGILYNLDEFDKDYYSHLRLKNGEKLFRYSTDRMIAGSKYLIKINLDKGLIYFMSEQNDMNDDKNISFETRGIKSEYITLDKDMFEAGGEVNSSTQKLIEELKKNSNERVSDVMTNKQGEKYRFRNWKLKYNSASNFLVKLFEKASEENTGKSYNRNFYNGNYSFYYNRPEMKNKPNGSMQMRMLEVLNNFEAGGMVEFHDYKGIEIMYEPTDKEYYANDMVFYSLEDAHEYIDSGEANKTPKHIVELYRRGMMAKGGNVSIYTDKSRFPNEREIVFPKDIDSNMMSFFDRTNKSLLVTLKNGKKIKASVGKFYNDIIFHGDFPKEIEHQDYTLQLKQFEKIEVLNDNKYADGGRLSGQDIYKLAEEMSEKDFRNKFLTLSKSEKDDVESLIRLGDDKKLALITILDKRNEPNNDDFYKQAYHYKAGGDVEDEKVYIDYLNKEKGFKRDRIYFDSYAEAVEWGKKNFERFNTDMINYV